MRGTSFRYTPSIFTLIGDNYFEASKKRVCAKFPDIISLTSHKYFAHFEAVWCEF
jgi:hypothetical protein